ncbi:PAS domain S-box protein [Terrimonas sp. NA20]|uniref:histidine kinase n=1 Tax=Terrimonas ginsenosidimutans TaxID=2908004 RepID=A0ABS9KXR6_9BACT|nr:PAS domain S-box protein [Terrimonas ginsenosidimutans]MCG2617110.1 PAS domain S-box protein [Terrimonas ginsenosidimutans]
MPDLTDLMAAFVPVSFTSYSIFLFMQQPPDNISSSQTPAPDNAAVPLEEINGLFAQSPVAIGLLKGPDMIISAANEALLSILGLPGNANGRKLKDILPPTLSEGFIQIVKSVYQTGIAYSDYEHLVRQQRNGVVEERYYTFNYNPYLSHEGQATGVIITAVEVTPRAVLSQRVAESETHYRRLIENSPVAMYACNKDGYITQFNKAAAQLFGREFRTGVDRWTAAWKMTGENGQYIPPEDSPMARALRTGKIPDEREIMLQNADGSIHIILDHPQLFLNESGEISGGLNAIIDITERKNAEKNAAILSAIIHSTDDAIIGKDLNGTIISWNPAAVKLFGYAEEEVIGTPVTRLFPADRMEEEPHIIERIRKGERIEHFDTIRIKKSGEPVEISLTISPIKDAAGRIIGASKIAREITAQKVLFRALQESEQKFRELVMQAPVGITILKGSDMVAELANDTYLQIVDRTRDEFIGKSLYESLPEVRQAVEPLLMGILQTGIPYYGNEFKVNIKRHGRVDTTYFNFVYQPLKELNGAITGIIVVANEVTEQVEAKHSVTESAKEFRRMVMQSPIAMTIFRGPEFVIEVANEVLLNNIWRLSEDQVMGRKALEVFPELNDQKYAELLRQVRRTGKAHRENESLAFVQGADGMKKFYLDYEYAPLFETDGTISGIMITVSDVTEKVEARHKVEDAEARLRLAAEGTGLATWDLNLVTREIIHTPRLAEIFGYPRDEQVSHQVLRSRVVQEDAKNIVEPAFAHAMETGTYFYEARIIRNDGIVRWIKTNGSVIFDQQHKPLRMLGTIQDVTEETNASRILEESEQRLNIALEATELGTWELNLFTRQPTYSPRYLQIVGFGPGEEPTHAELLERIHPDDRTKRDQVMTEALKTGRLDLEMRIITRSGETRWIRARGKLFYNKKGVAERMMGTLQDITEQKMAFISLQESEERFKLVADSAPVMIWMSGSDKFLDFFNATWLNFTGHSIDEERSEGWQKCVHPDDLERVVTAYNQAYRDQAAFYTEYRLRRHDGIYRWISDNAVPRYISGKFIGFISACMDIDEEKKFNERLQQSELLFKTISNVSPVGLWMTDENGRNTFVNDTWIKWTGISHAELYEHGWFQTLLEADRETVMHVFQRKREHRDKFVAEYRFKRADGSVRWAYSEGYPYYDQSGNFAGYAGSIMDITERKQDEIRKNEFLAVASHELKTPITSIKAYTQLLASTYQKTDDAFLKNALTKVENQVNKMSKLVGDFLNLSKIEADKVVLQKELFSVQEIVAEAVADIQLVAPAYAISLHAEADPLFINADREKIMQVLTNLLNNAVKYSPDEKEVMLRVFREGEEAVVTIEDRGIGIRPAEYEKIFERFYRADPNNIRVSGFGIGLYISAEIIRRHGGQIGVKGNEEKGACFYFRLPVAEK